MTEKLKWVGWLAAIVLFILLSLQRSCKQSTVCKTLLTHDTILVKGDSQLMKIQDTVLKPYRVYYPVPGSVIYKDSMFRIDTAKLIQDYFASRTYMDTVRSRDVTAVIEDSVSANKIAGRKVFIENSRDLNLTEIGTKPVNKIFIGCFLGLSQRSLQPSTGVSIMLLTRKDACYSYHFDPVSMTHTIGLAWKIHFVGRE